MVGLIQEEEEEESNFDWEYLLVGKTAMYCRVPPVIDVTANEDRCNRETTATIDSDSSTTKIGQDDKPKHISTVLWEKFKLLEKRTDNATSHSTAKRIKHLQKSVIDKVQEEIHTEEDKDILVEHDVKFGPPVREQVKLQNRKRKIDTTSEQVSDINPENSKWQEVKPFLTAKDHLKGTDPGKYASKSGLEKKIDVAIEKGDFKTAEELSDRLANREFGKKIAEAIDARNYSKMKEQEKESAKAKKKKKLPWGFEHKQRWETKSNM